MIITNLDSNVINTCKINYCNKITNLTSNAKSTTTGKYWPKNNSRVKAAKFIKYNKNKRFTLDLKYNI